MISKIREKTARCSPQSSCERLLLGQSENLAPIHGLIVQVTCQMRCFVVHRLVVSPIQKDLRRSSFISSRMCKDYLGCDTIYIRALVPDL